ncbi:MAG: SAM-dependent chlorinase/fluorinase, partial [Deltaproteobacteria bacterium]|nr:SAM-dependent chlorinase/fluorinase [Deltaproteobacteria bacterium]
NLITNISSQELYRFLGSGRPRIEVGKLVIPKLSRTYSDEEKGTPLALINSSDLLEIAVNLARASDYIGLKAKDTLGALVRVLRD